MKRLVLTLLFPLLVLAWGVWLFKFVWAVIFDPDHGWRLAVAKDQLANAAFNGHEDETISSRAGRHSRKDSDRETWAICLCWILDKVDKNHCEKSIGV